jgi:ferredoxin
MTFVVTEPCIKCKYTNCVAVCPADAFREGPNFLVIDPEDCIDCGVCVPECPVKAIFADTDVSEDQAVFIDINSGLARKWKVIVRSKPSLPDADYWATVPHKLHLLVR